MTGVNCPALDLTRRRVIDYPLYMTCTCSSCSGGRVPPTICRAGRIFSSPRRHLRLKTGARPGRRPHREEEVNASMASLPIDLQEGPEGGARRPRAGSLARRLIVALAGAIVVACGGA